MDLARVTIFVRIALTSVCAIAVGAGCATIPTPDAVPSENASTLVADTPTPGQREQPPVPGTPTHPASTFTPTDVPTTLPATPSFTAVPAAPTATATARAATGVPNFPGSVLDSSVTVAASPF